MNRNQEKAMFAKLKQIPTIKARVVGEVRTIGLKKITGVHAIQKGYSGSRFFGKPTDYKLSKINPKRFSKIRYKGMTFIG